MYVCACVRLRGKTTKSGSDLYVCCSKGSGHIKNNIGVYMLIPTGMVPSSVHHPTLDC